ncbi:hypothetical protein L198_03821 [Cryptococcus wingfieldii CBS 7118]|uniref:Homeobox domain-containing protein n=1 Tax=Cryptococcus wingfieldii CBS 7118 TaxID=1295528 RepID=A0A1E3J8R1_9TREE|nr:hypothetical protein L198_03821 [Cryptococcus wingfieldii CBS 7118]ODN97258.1 hypothetical protein L198_03821 [Cryptococcus wingfieldii CBS 7118]
MPQCTRSSSRVRSKPSPSSSLPSPAATRTSPHAPTYINLPRASSESAIASVSSPSLLKLPLSHTSFLAGLQPPATAPWSSSEPEAYLEWVPAWWHDESHAEHKLAAIDKKSENEWDYLESAWLDNSRSKSLGRRRFTTSQLQLLEVQWSLDTCPEKVERQRLARYMGTKTKHVNIWFQNRRQYTKKAQTGGEDPQPAYLAVEGRVQPTSAMKSIVQMIVSGQLHRDNCLAMAAGNLETATSRPDRSARRKPLRLALTAPTPDPTIDLGISVSVVSNSSSLSAKHHKRSRNLEETSSNEDPRIPVPKRPREDATSFGKQNVDSKPLGEIRPAAGYSPASSANRFSSMTHDAHSPTSQRSFAHSVTFDDDRRPLSAALPITSTYFRPSICSPPTLSQGSSSASSTGSFTFEQMVSVPRAWSWSEAVPTTSMRRGVGHEEMLKDEDDGYDTVREVWDILDAADILLNMGRRASVC